MKYDAMYFLEKFDKIPDSKWCTQRYRHKGKCCAVGHCLIGIVLAREAQSLLNLMNNNLRMSTYTINDACDYSNLSIKEALDLGDTPKERIMNALMLVNAGVKL